MAKFDAGSAVDPMEFDFTKFGGGAGEIPEPSTGQMEAFFGGLRDLISNVRKEVEQQTGLKVGELPSADAEMTDPAQQAKVADAVQNMDKNVLSKQQGQMATLLASLCSNQPGEADLNRLPFRVFAEFQKWIMGEINPNRGAVASKK